MENLYYKIRGNKMKDFSKYDRRFKVIKDKGLYHIYDIDMFLNEDSMTISEAVEDSRKTGGRFHCQCSLKKSKLLAEIYEELKYDLDSSFVIADLNYGRKDPIPYEDSDGKLRKEIKDANIILGLILNDWVQDIDVKGMDPEAYRQYCLKQVKENQTR